MNQLNYQAPAKSNTTDGLVGYSMDLRTNKLFAHTTG
jgi:hypothetical protein